MQDHELPGIRNNNPGNLERVGNIPWQGLSETQTDKTFYQFKDAIFGMRAVVCQLIAYQDKHGCRTIMNAISRFAPPADNNPTTVYGLNVAAEIGAFTGSAIDASSTPVDWHQYRFARPALEAIIKQENGASYTRWYTSAQLDKACIMAGVSPPKKSLAGSVQVVGGGLAAVASAAAPALDTLKEHLQPLANYSNGMQHVFIGVSVAGALAAAWAKIRERAKGIS